MILSRDSHVSDCTKDTEKNWHFFLDIVLKFYTKYYRVYWRSMLHLGRLGSEYARKGGKITKDYRSWFKKSAANMFWRIISSDRKNILSELQDSSITSLAYAKALRLPLRMKQNCEDDWEND